MKNKNLTITLILSALIISGCSITQHVEPTEFAQQEVLCIVENEKVKKGFIDALKSALDNKNIKHKTITADEKPSCNWVTEYTANWSWDMSLYMSYAEIKVFHNKQLDGEAIYDARSGGGRMDKFIDAEEKINELIEQLMQLKTSSLFNKHFG